MKKGVQDWEESGKGRDVGDIGLDDAHVLAVKGGFTFTEDDTVPPRKRANLQAMFDRFDCTSLTSFREKFYLYRLCPTQGVCSGGGGGGGIEEWKSVVLPASQCGGSGQRYVGCTKDGRPHGEGMLLRQGSIASVVHIGVFEGGRQHGYGAILTPRGEMFHGFFKESIMWGPGVYTFPRPLALDKTPSSSSSCRQSPPPPPSSCHRVKFQGMHNGRPCGLGRMIWSDGSMELGIFDGQEVQQTCNESAEDVQGVILVAEKNAEFAKRVVAEVLDALKSHPVLWKDHCQDEMERVLAAQG